jgi:archaellum biogenesis protein FlaJ (TadC family)
MTEQEKADELMKAIRYTAESARQNAFNEFRDRLAKAIELNDYKLYEMVELGEYDQPYLTIESITKFVREFEIQ